MKCHKLITKENHFHFMFINVNNFAIHKHGCVSNAMCLHLCISIPAKTDLAIYSIAYERQTNSCYM